MQSMIWRRGPLYVAGLLQCEQCDLHHQYREALKQGAGNFALKLVN